MRCLGKAHILAFQSPRLAWYMVSRIEPWRRESDVSASYGGFIRALAITFMFSQVKRMGEAPSPNCWQESPDVSTHIGSFRPDAQCSRTPLESFRLDLHCFEPVVFASTLDENSWKKRRSSQLAPGVWSHLGCCAAVPPPLGDREDMKGNPMRSGPNLVTCASPYTSSSEVAPCNTSATSDP